jgi:5-methylcytosine-specific restriction protein A
MNQNAKWQKLYKCARWQRMRRLQLRLYPLCAKCESNGIVNAAEVVHHVHPHKGDYKLFYFSKLESLCKHCHDGITQQQERYGYCNDIGVDGWPIDDRHPVYSGTT